MIHRLREKFEWMGHYSGYDQLHKHVDRVDQSPSTTDYWCQPSSTREKIEELRVLKAEFAPDCRFVNRFAAGYLETELQILQRVQGKEDIVHISYLENSSGLLVRKAHGVKLVATSHQPPSWWKQNHGDCDCLNQLGRLSRLIVVGKAQAEFFEAYLPGKVELIPHGVDTSFFSPGDQLTDPRNVVTSGQWMRDFETLEKVIHFCHQRAPELVFHVVQGKVDFKAEALNRISKRNNVKIFSGLSDLEYRRVLQQSFVGLLPLLDASANNSLLEFMSTGLGIVSTNVGDVCSYLDFSCSSLFSVGDFEGMAKAILEIYESRSRRESMGRSARNSALKYDWRNVADQTYEVYLNQLTSSSKPVQLHEF